MLSKLNPLVRDSLILAGALAMAVGGTWAVSETTIEHLLHHDAVSAGSAWAGYLAKNVEDLDQIAAGQKPSADSQRFFDRVQEVGQVFRYIIYDPQGHVRLLSDDFRKEADKGKGEDKSKDNDDDDEDLATHNPEAARSIAGGEPLINVEEGEGPDRPPFFAEAYLPVVVKGKTVAIVEVYVDQTEKRDDYRRTFVVSTLALGLLIGLAFGIPALAWRRRANEKRIADEHIRFLANHDSLTGLPNRNSFVATLDAALARSLRQGDALAIHHINIDRFKDINDALGHEVGDELLSAVGQRLRAMAGPDGAVARLGADEFAILQTGLADKDDAQRFGQALADELSRPYAIDGRDVAITASVGIAAAPGDGDDAARLMKSAELALYRSKADGRNAIRLFSSAMEADLNERLRLERAIREGLAGDRFELHFQPAVQMPERRLVGFEALLRLRDERGAPIPPATFIPIAEQIGLIGAIGTWVLREACKTAVAWPDPMKVAVNLSPAQFADGDLYEKVVAALADSGLAPRRLELEITEGLLLKDSDAIMDELRRLKQFGVGIVMDDFGTGYSSLSYLWKFPFDKLKIDRAFMQALEAEDHQNAEAIVRTIIDLGRSLHVTVTVEGVENDRQVAFVEAAGCDEIQGYYFARPLPVTDIAGYIVRDLQASLSRANQAADAPLAIEVAG
jgi:diguanylate cyclase (GGDEF)-like protein